MDIFKIETWLDHFQALIYLREMVVFMQGVEKPFQGLQKLWQKMISNKKLRQRVEFAIPELCQ